MFFSPEKEGNSDTAGVNFEGPTLSEIKKKKKSQKVKYYLISLIWGPQGSQIHKQK